MKPLAKISTINQFWRMYQFVKRPSSFENDTILNIFVEDIKPEWEAPEHLQAGCWNLRINKGYADQIWENLLLGMIGEQFSLPDVVTGIVIQIGF